MTKGKRVNNSGNECHFINQDVKKLKFLFEVKKRHITRLYKVRRLKNSLFDYDKFNFFGSLV
jgi:hypothetical protein